jgi:hypothetical protein
MLGVTGAGIAVTVVVPVIVTVVAVTVIVTVAVVPVIVVVVLVIVLVVPVIVVVVAVTVVVVPVIVVVVVVSRSKREKIGGKGEKSASEGDFNGHRARFRWPDTRTCTYSRDVATGTECQSTVTTC